MKRRGLLLDMIALSRPSQLTPEALGSSTVPYLSFANDSCPAEIHAIPSCCFGNLIRTKNIAEIDLAVTVTTNYEITGEAKNHESGLTLEYLQRIMNKIPPESRLIIWSSLQRYNKVTSNHPSQTWSQYKESHTELQDLALLKLEVEFNGPDSPSFQLKPLFEGCNSESSSYHRYLVVYPVDALCDLQTELSTNKAKAAICVNKRDRVEVFSEKEQEGKKKK